MRSFVQLLATLVFITLGFSTALAGQLEKGVYTSNHGYTITVPEGWKVVDNSNHGALKDELPAPLASADVNVYDVLFWDPDVKEPGETDPPMVFDNIMILVVKPVNADDTAAKSLAASEKVDLTKLFPQVESVSAGKAEHGGAPTMDLEWKIGSEEEGFSGAVLQSVFQGFERSLIVTCTINGDRYEKKKALCVQALDSIKLND